MVNSIPTENKYEAIKELRKRIEEPSFNRPAQDNLQNSDAANRPSEYSPADLSPETNGWNNLIALVAFLGCFRFILVNIVELGWLVQIPFCKLTLKELIWIVFYVLFYSIRILAFYLISRFKIPAICYISVTEAAFAFLIFRNISKTTVSAFLYTYSVVVNMKMISYLFSANDKNFTKYLEFLIFPTLVYKDSYKRKSKCDFKIIAKCSVKLFFSLFLFCFFMDQHAVPAFFRVILLHSLNSFIDGVFNFCLASIILFNLFFKIFFDYTISILCELTSFDEKAYGEWWNSRSSEEFWSKWNIPVHTFVKKHMYSPLVSSGIDKHAASLLCFLLSGALHEYVVSLSLKSFNGWFLIGMVVQIPLHFVSNYVKRKYPSLGNIFFWLSFCVIGQPMLIILIYRTFYIKNNIDLHNYNRFIHTIM